MLPLRSSFACLWRVLFIGAPVTTRGMQHLGLIFALDPGLKFLYKDDAQKLKAARKRYLEHINTHPIMAPILVGFLLSLEHLVATHKMPAQNMQKLIHTTAETLSAIGDSFFSGTLMVFWALVSILLILHNYFVLSIVGSAFLLALLLIFRIRYFFLALRHGLLVLTKIRALNLVNISFYLKVINALLIAAIYYSMGLSHAGSFIWTEFFGGILVISMCAILINTAHIPRVVLASLSFFVFSLYWFKPNLF